MREHDRERGVVADGADVAEVVGHALKLCHQRAQPLGARRRRNGERRLDGLRECNGVGDRAVATRASGEFGAALDCCARKQTLDALVHISEPLLQPHHRLAVGVEAEMPRLDDAGVHGADRDLVQRRALGRIEGIGGAVGRHGLELPEWVAHAPTVVVEPGAQIGAVLRLDAIKIADRALQTQRGRMAQAHGREGVVAYGHADDRDLGALEESHVDILAVAPQPEKRHLSGSEADDRSAPRLLIELDARPGAMCRDGSAAIDQCRQKRHGPAPHPKSRATF